MSDNKELSEYEKEDQEAIKLGSEILNFLHKKHKNLTCRQVKKAAYKVYSELAEKNSIITL